MATFRQIVYTVLDEIKSVNGDSLITEDHVIFLANQYRLFLIQQKINKEGQAGLSSSNQQTICLDLEEVEAIPGDPCEGSLLRSIQEVPSIISGTVPAVFPYNYFDTRIAYISEDRMKYVGYNKYLRNIIYCCLQDNHLYLKSQNPQFLYLEKVRLQGVFEDAEAAATLSCDDDGNECREALDTEFPLSGDMVPQMIELLVKELLSALFRPKDDLNNSADDIAELVAYVRRNMKSKLSKQITE